MNYTNSPNANAVGEAASDLAHSAARGTEHAISATQRVTQRAADTVQNKLDSLRDSLPSAISRAGQQADELTRAGIERARSASTAVREKAAQSGDQMVTYIRDEPVKAVLVAAAAGALTAVLLGWLNRSSSPRPSRY